MVRTPSLSGHEQDLAKLVVSTMEAQGYDEVRVDKYGNVVGRVAGSCGGKRILFEGHMDHVDIGDREKWTKEPYGGEVDGGKIHGRGTSDMKGSLAAMIMAGAWLKEDFGGNLGGDVLVAGSVHEECFEGMASAEIGRVYRPDYVVIGEASHLDLKRGQRGRAEIVLETHGKTAHSSNPNVGINAVKKMVKALSSVEAGYRPPTHQVLGRGILEVTDIISRPYPGSSVVPEVCRVTFDRRLLVGETKDTVLGSIRSILKPIAEDDPEFRAEVSVVSAEDVCYTGEPIGGERFAPGWILEEEHEFVQSSLTGLREVGLKPNLSHYAFCTNGSYYAGVAGIPTIGFGASEERLAHVTDEYIEIDQLCGAAIGYYGIARRVLGRGK